MSIFDLSGKMVLSPRDLNSGNGVLDYELDTHLFDNGIYVVKMIADDDVFFRKLIVSH
jgi:hypothetical protein